MPNLRRNDEPNGVHVQRSGNLPSLWRKAQSRQNQEKDGNVSADNLIRVGEQARLLGRISNDRKVQRLANQAMKHVVAGLQSHNEGALNGKDPRDWAAGVNKHLEYATGFVTDAAKLHADSLEARQNPDPQVLDIAYLGDAHGAHEDYAQSISEGMKNNGR